MIKIFMGILIGFALGYYFPNEVATGMQKGQELFHEGASKAAEATKPQSEFTKMLDKVTDPLKGN